MKPAEVPAFSGDAWAAAMAAGVEEKLAEQKIVESSVAEVVATPEAVAQAAEASAHEAAVQQTLAEARAELNSFSSSPSPWEIEAKKATLLASTWDHAVAEPAQAFSNGTAPEVAGAPVADAPVEETPVEGTSQHYASEAVVESPIEEQQEATEPSAYVHEEIAASHSAVASEPETERSAQETVRAEIGVNETQEIEPYREPESAHQESTWVAAPAEVVNQFMETPAQEFAPAQTESTEQEEQPAQVEESAPAAEPLPEVVAEVAVQPNMDDLVARVLSRMSPDVLQKVTQDILKPVIAAIIQDELNAKKQ